VSCNEFVDITIRNSSHLNKGIQLKTIEVEKILNYDETFIS
jgi:hypothetical protein